MKENVEHFTNGKLLIPNKIRSTMDIRETERAIKFIKDYFEENFSREMNLQRVSAPLAVLRDSGINDYLSGTEQPAAFKIKSTQQQAEIVQALSKWKRKALADYGFISGEGIYTDMNAIRPDEPFLDNMHSVYVDQWDWERIIAENERNLNVLKYIVRKIYNVIYRIEQTVCRRYPKLQRRFLPEEIFFIHTEDLLDMYPDLPPPERENAICKEKKAVFIIGIGANLKDGKPHDDRASDYDDWSTETEGSRHGLNGDILVWYPVLNCAMELSSMGIRVDKTALKCQLKLKNEEYKAELDFHKRILNDELPLSIGGGIGQSRLCMFYLRKAHIGEVQSSIWNDEMHTVCRQNHIFLL